MKYLKNKLLIDVFIAITIVILIFFIISLNRTENKNIEKYKQVRACNDITLLLQSFNLFKLDNGSYPETNQGIKSLLRNPDKKYKDYKPLISILFKDPWGNPYIYTKLSEDSIKITSYGKDGKIGGKGYASDIFYLYRIKDLNHRQYNIKGCPP